MESGDHKKLRREERRDEEKLLGVSLRSRLLEESVSSNGITPRTALSLFYSFEPKMDFQKEFVESRTWQEVSRTSSNPKTLNLLILE